MSLSLFRFFVLDFFLNLSSDAPDAFHNFEFKKKETTSVESKFNHHRKGERRRQRHPRVARQKGKQHHQRGSFLLLSLSLFCFLFPFLVHCRGHPLPPLRGLHNRISTTKTNPISIKLLSLFFHRFRSHFLGISFFISMFCQCFLFFMCVS